MTKQKMLLITTISSVLALTLLVLFLSPQPNTKKLSTPAQIHQNIRNSIINSDFPLFKSNVYLQVSSQNDYEVAFKSIVKDKRINNIVMNRYFIDLSSGQELLKTIQQQDWIICYFKDEVTDEQHGTLHAVLFKKHDGKILACGKIAGLIKAKAGSELEKRGFASWSGNENYLNEIEKHNFSPESIIKSFLDKKLKPQSNNIPHFP